MANATIWCTGLYHTGFQETKLTVTSLLCHFGVTLHMPGITSHIWCCPGFDSLRSGSFCERSRGFVGVWTICWQTWKCNKCTTCLWFVAGALLLQKHIAVTVSAFHCEEFKLEDVGNSPGSYCHYVCLQFVHIPSQFLHYPTGYKQSLMFDLKFDIFENQLLNHE